MRSDEFNVAEYLLAGKADEDLCLLTLDGSCTYGDLRGASSALAGYLHERGAKKGDRVLLIGENSFFWVAGYLGLLRAGLVCVPVPPSAPPPRIQFFAEHTGARFALVQSSLLPRIGNTFSPKNMVLDCKVECGPAEITLSSLLAKESRLPLPASSASSTDLAALMFTSGSTRQPQAVMISHGNIRANTESIIEYMGLRSRDRVMVVLPFHYCFGTSLLHTHLRVGGTLVLDSRFMYPEGVLQRMRETDCTGFAGVPSHYRILLDNTSLRRTAFPSLRYVQQAGGHLEGAAIRRVREALPATQVFVMYGQTEATARLSFLPPELLNTKLGSIGKGIPGVRLSVENEGRPVQPGEVGEIVAEGENIAQGYWHDPEETARIFQNGRLHTGDMATVDEGGFITIVSRARDFLKCGGTRISCQQLEQRILESGDLQEVAVIGVPDEIMGEAVKAFVVPRINASTTPEQVRRFCKTRLPFQLVPREIVVLDTLPKNDSGKVLKEQLRSYGA
jgi:long-chain acyl-CoA synthetase